MQFKYDKKIIYAELIYVQLLYLHGFTNSIFISKNIKQDYGLKNISQLIRMRINSRLLNNQEN